MALCALSRLHQILAKALESGLKPFRIGRTGYFLLTTLALTTGRSAQLSTLSRLMGVHPTTVTLTIDHLEAEGLVTRRPHHHDRRTTIVEITEEGMERVRKANEALSHAETTPLDGMSGLYEDLFTALQPIREAAGDTAL